ncbi:MAG: MlaD family protein [Synechococcaceae cyanobacterium]|nr:MlaD family protein [Synechococcaceae cyanobacterium]
MTSSDPPESASNPSASDHLSGSPAASPLRPRLDDVIPIRGNGSLPLFIGSLVLLLGFGYGMARFQRWFSISGPVQIRTSNASGLQEGLDVRISGYRIGQIESLRLDSDARVTVSLLIEPAYRSMLGPLSQARLMQDSLIGVPYLAVTHDPRSLLRSSRTDSPQRRLQLQYTPAINLTDLVVQVAESRLPLNRLLDTTNRLAEREIPQTVRSVEGTLRAARSLAEELRAQTRVTASDARSTAAAARRTLAVYSNLGVDGQRRLQRGEEELRAHGPLLVDTLRDLNSMANTLNRLAHRLSSSWVMELLGPSRVPDPLGPAPSGAPPAAAGADSAAGEAAPGPAGSSRSPRTPSR